MSKFATAFSSMISVTGAGGSSALDRGISKIRGGESRRAANDTKYTSSFTTSGSHYKL